MGTSPRLEPTECISPDDEQPTTSDERENQSIQIIIKFLNDTRKEVSVNLNDTILKVKQYVFDIHSFICLHGSRCFVRLNFAEELADNKMIRFIYQGRELQDHETLRTYNIRDQTIIHCQISVRRHPTTTSSTRSNGMPSGAQFNANAFDTTAFFDASPVNISSHFVLLLSLILGFIWYLRIKYRALFSPISTIILILITIIFLIFTCGSLLTTRRPASNTAGRHPTIAQHVHIN